MHRSSRLMAQLVATMLVMSCKPAAETSSRAADSAFAAVEARGSAPAGMGVDQKTSTHQFDLIPGGARIELLSNAGDSADVAQIRQHLQRIATAFKAGDFSTPAFVHMKDVPGTAVMAARKDQISYTFHELPRGGELRIATTDSQALGALREFILFQRQDHRASGADMPDHNAHHDTSARK